MQQVEVPDRIRLPLSVLDAGKPLDSKTRLQKTVFLAQTHIQQNEYDFGKHHYGPYSDGLDLDSVCYPSLITSRVGIQSDPILGKHEYHYDITTEGREQLAVFRKMDGMGIVASVQSKARELGAMPMSKLLEEAYTKFGIMHTGTDGLEDAVEFELGKTMLPLKHSYRMFGNRQTVFVLSTLEMTEYVVSRARTADGIQRAVIFNMANEVVQKCKELARDIMPPTDSDFLRPRFMEINDLFYHMVGYCVDRNIADDPMKRPLDELMTEDEAVRLSKALAETSLAS